MIAARGMEQVSCKSVGAPYLQKEVHHHIPQALTCGIVLSKACARPMQKEETAGGCYRPC
eukprot:scaffold307641_cov159-Cyclotella_meneghiniana.AAC.1